MTPRDLAHYLDGYLDIAGMKDYDGAHNGLQVEGTRTVRRVALAVDACLYTITEAAAAEADMLIVHHGLFWSPVVPLVGAAYRRIAPLVNAGIGLYSVHLPLDAHPEVGNNHVLARLLSLEVAETWAAYEGMDVGVIGRGAGRVLDMARRVDEVLGVASRLIGNPDAAAHRVGIVSGGGSASIEEAANRGLDLFITGEAPHHAYLQAEELGVNMLLAGHYATETVGVRALGDHLSRRFGLETVFIEHPTGL
ncbi:MAG: Nif3-like dinuclear metal center hexameric protein [Chthonomonadales bacterium]|nr:Nif3-like dinuclear metal center hexameric protein [Chthonomonadales bacterium]